MTKELLTAIYEQLEVYKMKASSEDIAEFASMSKEDLSLCHFGLGLYLRNNNLTPQSNLYALFILNDIRDKDEMSSTIVRMWHERLNQEKTQ